jgi:hypothetical protein
VRLVVIRDAPIEEVAAEPATLRRFLAVFRRVLDGAAPGPDVRTVLDGGRGGLLSLPFVPDPTVPPLTVHLRPYSTPMGLPDACSTTAHH